MCKGLCITNSCVFSSCLYGQQMEMSQILAIYKIHKPPAQACFLQQEHLSVCTLLQGCCALSTGGPFYIHSVATLLGIPADSCNSPVSHSCSNSTNNKCMQIQVKILSQSISRRWGSYCSTH